MVKPRTRNPFSLCFIAGALLLAWAACSKTTSQVRGKQEKEKQIEVSSSVPIDPAALHQDTLPNAVKRLERVETAGDCAPRYKIGGVGSCINNQPCRGFAARDESGNIVCPCYGSPGCVEGQRCDDRKLTCVPEDEPLSDRLGSR